MTKYLNLVSIWLLVIGALLGLRTGGRMKADLADDFTFSLPEASGMEVDRFMPTSRVTEILQDRLDGTPMSDASRLSSHLMRLCKLYRFDPAFVLSLIQEESGFHSQVVSPYGAVGLMQVMPGTALVVARTMGMDLGLGRFRNPGTEETDLKAAARLLVDPFANLTFGMAYLASLRDHYRGFSAYYLVAAYNVGPGRMDELVARKSFRPVATKRYFEAIRRGVTGLRHYRRASRA